MVPFPPVDIEETIQWASREAKVPVAIVRSVAYHESHYNPGAVSPAGAKGLMQLMPAIVEEYGITDPFDQDQSARVGAELLSKLYGRYKDWSTALAAYVWGSGNVKKTPEPNQWPQKVKTYVAKVMGGANMQPPFFEAREVITRLSPLSPQSFCCGGG